ncbi:serine hydrolase domain-containing protein [Acidomonas methanolica]|nr:serine hydrolase domain-containing protein [Acidomonas methanolica]MBU2653919.1 beta-lactamase family protein [Acidomonas methanolica]
MSVDRMWPGRRAVLAGLPLLVAGCAARGREDRFAAIGARVRRAVAEGKTPGAVVAVGHGGALVYQGAFGSRALVPERLPMRWDTEFDMASLTKVLVTAPCVMRLWEEGFFRLDDPVARYWPEFGANGKSGVTIRMLLTHYSGLPPDLDLKEAWSGKAAALDRVAASGLDHAPGTRFVYSDINFITLGVLVERFSGQPLQDYAREMLFAPMRLSRTRFLPPDAWKPTIAPTQYDERGVLLQGVVHDPTARRMGGVAGHAGLFSDMHDVCVYAQALLDRLAGRPSPYPLRQATLKLMTTPQQPLAGAQDLRGLGWDIATHYSSPRGTVFPVGSFGHTGFTGTSLWFDPGSGSFVAILTNRVHPDGKGNVIALRRDVATLAGEALRESEAGVSRPEALDR